MPDLVNRKLSTIVDNIVHKALQVKPNDSILIDASCRTLELSRAIALESRKAGADTMTTLFDEELWFESVRTLPLSWLKKPQDWKNQCWIHAPRLFTSALSLIQQSSEPSLLNAITPNIPGVNEFMRR